MNDISSTPKTATDGTNVDLDEFLGAPAARPWYKRKRFIIGAVLLVALILLLSRFFGGGSGEASYVSQPVTRGDLTVTVSATGNLQPTNQVDVGSELSGLVENVYVDNNDRVTRGQVLARIDTSRLEDSVRQSRAQTQAAQASVGQAQATLQQAQANLRRLEEVYRLSGGKVPSATELDAGRAEAARALASLRSAQAQVVTAQAQLSTDLTQLGKASIVSPVNGVVLSRQIEPGQTVAASFNAPVLFTIAEDLSAMRLEVKVDEADVGQVAAGQRATFAVDAFPGRSFPASIERVDLGANASGSTASTTTTASTVVAYTARLTVANPELLLRPGMTATADIVTMEKKNVLLVPNAALRFSPGGSAGAGGAPGGVTGMLVPRPGRFGQNRGNREVTIGRGSRQTVYVEGADGNPEPVQVTVGDTNGTLTEVIGGLKPGQKVITGQMAAGAVGAPGGNRPGGAPGGQGGRPGAGGGNG